MMLARMSLGSYGKIGKTVILHIRMKLQCTTSFDMLHYAREKKPTGPKYAQLH